MACEAQATPPVKPPRRYQMLEMSQSLGNEIKVCNFTPDNIAAPTLQLLQCSASSATNENSHTHSDQMRMQQIDSLAEELRQTSLKNVNTKKSYGNVLSNSTAEQKPAPKQRSRRPSGQWKITSVTIEESNSKNLQSCANNSEQSMEHQQFQQNHVNKFVEGGYQFQQENTQSTVFQGKKNITEHQSFQQSSSSDTVTYSCENGYSGSIETNSPSFDQNKHEYFEHNNNNSPFQQNYSESKSLDSQSFNESKLTNTFQQQQASRQVQNRNSQNTSVHKNTFMNSQNNVLSQHESTNYQTHQNMFQKENRKYIQENREETAVQKTNYNHEETFNLQNGNDKMNKSDGKGSMKYIPNYLSLCPKPSDFSGHAEESRNTDYISGRRNSVCQSFINTDTSKSRSSRASSVDPNSRPIFSFLKIGDDPNAHRTRQPSNLASRRNSTAGLQKYSSQEYLNQGHMSDLKIRNNPVLLAQPKEMKNDGNSFLSRDGSMYQSTEALNSGTRTRHRSASQSREDKSYTWNGRNSLTGTGLRIGSAVTEPEPKDGLALSKDGGFFMPFGNNENISKKCKTKRQLKAEEELRKQQEKEEERLRAHERQKKKEQRKEKRIRNRTLSVAANNRNNQENQQTNIQNNNEIITNNNENLSTTENRSNIITNKTACSGKVMTEIENIQILKKDVLTDLQNKDTTMNIINSNTTNIHTESKDLNELHNQNSNSKTESTDETKTFQYERNTEWQKFGAEYNEYGELISCGKEPVGARDGMNVDGYEKRDRSNAFWHEGEGYEGCTGGYGQRSDGSGSMRGRWDNVRRGPVLHASQDPEFVPDR